MQTHEEHDNRMMLRTIGALALCPTRNTQGSFHFFSLSTGRVITPNWARPLPMPDNVINQVNWIAWCQKANPGLIFADHVQRLRAVTVGKETDSKDDSSYSDDDASDGSDDEWDGAEHNQDVNDDPGEQTVGVDDQEDQQPVEIVNADENQMEEQNNVEIAGVHNKQEAEMAGVHEEQEVEDNDDDAGQDVRSNDEDQRQLETEMDAKYGQRSGRYDLRSRKERDYSHLFTTKSMQLKSAQLNIEEKPRKSYAKQMIDDMTEGAVCGPSGGTPNSTEQSTDMRSIKDAEHGTGRKAVACDADQNAVWKAVSNADQETILETPQVNMNQGIKMFGKIQQLHDRKVMKAKDAKELTRE